METAVHLDMLILYAADYFDHSRADDIFEHERQIAREMGFATALFDFDSGQLFSVDGGGELDLPLFEERKSLYRGWQSSSPSFYDDTVLSLLSELGSPVTSSEAYECLRSSEMYGEYVGHLMPRTINLSFDEAMDEENLRDALSELGGVAFVKDYVKSVRGLRRIELDEDGNVFRALDVLHRIAEYRGNAFAGGFCLKQWCEFDEQVRVFVISHEVGLCCEHDCAWGGGLPADILSQVLYLPSEFYTVDLGHDSLSGNWFVVECGDGQESDCGSIEKMQEMYKKLSMFA